MARRGPEPGRRTALEPSNVMKLLLIGPGGEDAAQYELRPGRNRVGRGPGNDVVLDGESVSGHHGEIHLSVEGIRLRDLGSLNGTWIGGSRIEETPLEAGRKQQVLRLSFGRFCSW